MCSARPRSARRAARGFSLLEAVAATAFLAVALMAFAANTIWLTHDEKSADSTSAAHALAQQKLEQLRSTPLGAAAVAPGINVNDPSNPLQADGTAGGTFTRTWKVSGNDQPTFGLRTVTVTVSWRDTRLHFTTLAAYIRCSTIPC
jgi:Tfp pilus assembly protein PilV